MNTLHSNMKKKILILIFCGLLLTACGKAEESSSKADSKAVETTTATADSVDDSSKITVTTTESKAEVTTATTTTTKKPVSSRDSKPDADSQEDENPDNQPVYEENIQDEYYEYEHYDEPPQNISNQQNPQNNQNSPPPQTTTAKPVTTTKAAVTEPPSTGLSQSDMDEINRYIKETAQSYGIGTQCSDCNNEGAVILTGSVDPWDGYAWDTPIAGDFHETVTEYKTGVASRIKTMYNEWISNGETVEDISECMYIYVYWEKQSDNTYDLYLMW